MAGKVKRIKKNGKVRLYKETDLTKVIKAVAEIQEVLEKEGRVLKKKIIPDKAG